MSAQLASTSAAGEKQCRLFAEQFLGRSRNKEAISDVILRPLGIDVIHDDEHHPPSVCLSCDYKL